MSVGPEAPLISELSRMRAENARLRADLESERKRSELLHEIIRRMQAQPADVLPGQTSLF